MKNVKVELPLKCSTYNSLTIEYNRMFNEFCVNLDVSKYSDDEPKSFSLGYDDFMKFADAIERIRKLMVLA